ncbi:MAG TPA: hypothetical protein PK802_02030 [Candidatus Cloacimonadota bacterium]|jgi:ABC-type iron transport system FetAB ATPase subunit|nr:hypothetical protein [Candidatus Cloacimonadota bacterium]HOG30999.1 hypothetical protein [Candidatus Cloacimonadota bacterium]HOR58017.1 hypothetical protein [Candidatus Cloacimonadota bacterium]HPB08452.1 hypothetical protein [Candidatus Cloacimonadota bacterium]HPL22924.1 hypothetical protein [Candidatus Cloacimonadota bacterium]
MTNVFYFKINLNKFGEMKLQTERENKTFRNAVIAYLVGTLIMFGGLFYLNGILKKKVENRRKFLKATEEQLKQFQASEEYLSMVDVDRLAQTFNNRIFWAKKLVALSDEITRSLAVRKFTYSNGVLTLNGITPVDNNVKELDLINDFIQRLLANPEISNDFPQIKSGLITKQLAKDTAIMEFVIECYSREASESRRSGQ